MDRHVTIAEVFEYGPHFVSEAPKLVPLLGPNALVDVKGLIIRVQAAIDLVNTELTKAGYTRSDLRTGRTDVSVAVPAMRDVLERFFKHLGSLPASTGIDIAAFFPGNKLGALTRLKPADLRAKADAVLLGFGVPANAALGGLATWKNDVQAARDVLDAALKGKGSSRGDSIAATASMRAAHRAFLALYNGVAKHLVQGALNEIGRGDDMALYFLDLQVNETAKKKDAPAPQPAVPPNGTP